MNFPFGIAYFRGRTVSFRVGNIAIFFPVGTIHNMYGGFLSFHLAYLLSPWACFCFVGVFALLGGLFPRNRTHRFLRSRTPKEPEYLIARSDFERGPLGFGPIQFLMDCYVFCLLFFPLTSMIWGLPVDSS